jgi:ferredoxin
MSAGPAGARAHWYVCGPDGLRRAVIAAAAQAGVPTGRAHVEVFASPAERVVAGRGVAARIRLADSGRTLDARPGETLLETLERGGYKPAFSCRAGACGTCALRKVAGRTRGDEGGALSGRERASGYVLACCAQPVGDVTLASANTGAAPAVAARARHARGKRTLRVALLAATAAVFLGAWTLTDHSINASTTSSSSSVSGSSSSDDSGGSSSSSNSSNASNASGNSGFTTAPSSSAPSTSTGTS